MCSQSPSCACQASLAAGTTGLQRLNGVNSQYWTHGPRPAPVDSAVDRLRAAAERQVALGPRRPELGRASSDVEPRRSLARRRRREGAVRAPHEPLARGEKRVHRDRREALRGVEHEDGQVTAKKRRVAGWGGRRTGDRPRGSRGRDGECGGEHDPAHSRRIAPARPRDARGFGLR